jgi:hypothetical protein
MVTHLSGKVHLSRQEEGFKARLTAAADSVEALRGSYEDELEARDHIVLEAVDAGVTRGQAARWARLDPARITRIVVKMASRS